MRTTDCLILGGGLAGWMAARECVLAGLRPLIVQDGQGASPWVHGFNAPVHPEDSPACFLEDTLQSGQGLSTPELASALCEDALDVFELLRSLNLSFNREGDGYQMLRPLGASHPRVVSIGNETGVAVLKTLRKELEGRVDEWSETRALRLTTNGKQVTGALCYHRKDQSFTQVAAKTVVLACGGYCGIFPVSTNKRDSGGDGVAMAYEAGARMCDMEFIQFEPSAALWPAALIGTSMITTLLFEGAVLRNREGERFMLRYDPEGEKVGKDVTARRIAEEVAAGHGTKHGGVYFDATAVGRERLESGYAMYVERYRAVGIDLASEWIELGPAPHTSLGGVQMDENGRTSLEGLYACGEVTGGLHGANRIGGNAGLETLVFGRRAGRSAAAYAQRLESAENAEEKNILPVFGGEGCGEFLSEARQKMQQALQSGAGAVRNGENLARSEETLRCLLQQIDRLHGKNGSEEFERLRLRNDLTAALMTVISARARLDTLGCHTRSDWPEPPEEAYRVIIQKNGAGRMECRKEEV